MNCKLVVFELLLITAAAVLPWALGRMRPEPWAPPEGAVLRLEHERAAGITEAASGEAAPDALPEPRFLTSLFHIPQGFVPRHKEQDDMVKADPETRLPVTETKPAPPVEGRFKLLGIIRDAQNNGRLYLKEQESGRIVTTGMDDVLESGAGHYLIRLDDTTFIIRRD